jgi:hypothetical protein
VTGGRILGRCAFSDGDDMTEEHVLAGLGATGLSQVSASAHTSQREPDRRQAVGDVPGVYDLELAPALLTDIAARTRLVAAWCAFERALQTRIDDHPITA